MSSGDERREARRFTMSLPLTVMAPENTGPQLETETRDVSYRGLYFHASSKLQAGHAISFTITLPPQAAQSGEVKIRCRGHVVRIEPTENGRIGVAAKIDHYEFVPSEANAA